MYTSYIIMMFILEIIKLPVWLPPCHSNRGHNFETGMERLRWCRPALVSEMGSDPEGFITINSRTNQPVEFWTFAGQPDMRKKLEKEQDLRNKPDDLQAEPNSDWAE